MTRIWKCSWTRSRKQAASAFSPTNSAARRSNVPVSLVGNSAHQTKTLCARPNAGLSGSMEQGEARVGYEAVDRIIGAARSRGRFCLPLRSSLFSGESPRNFLILPPIQRSKNLGPAPSLQLRVIRQPYTLHHPARGGSSLMPSSHTDPEICARHNLGSSRPARRLPRCTLRRNLRSTAQPQKTKTLRASKALGLRL